MALTRVNRHQESFTTDSAAAQTTSSFTPANNTLLVVVAYFAAASDDASEGTTLTIADSVGLTWTSHVVTSTSPSWSYGIRIWSAPVTTGSSMTVSVDVGATTIDAMRIEVYEYSGYDAGTPAGATATGSDADGDGPASITLSAAPAATSEVISVVGFTLNSSTNGTVTEGAGWTELFDTPLTAGASFGHMQTQVRSGSVSTSVDWVDLEATGDTVAAVMVALEIRASSAGPPGRSTAYIHFSPDDGEDDALSAYGLIDGTSWFGYELSVAKWFDDDLTDASAGGTLFFQSVDGTLTFIGVLVKQTNKPLTGTLTLAGALTKLTSRALDGTLSFVGSLIKQTNKVLDATLSLSGALTSIRLFAISLTAALGLAGDLTKQTQKTLDGTLSLAGALVKQTNKILAGALSVTGALVKQTQRALSGTLSFIGALATLYIPFFGGGSPPRKGRRMFGFFSGRR